MKLLVKESLASDACDSTCANNALSKQELASWDHSAHLLNVFVAVLSILSPQFFRKEEAQRAAQCPEMEYKAACVSNLLSNLQVLSNLWTCTLQTRFTSPPPHRQARQQTQQCAEHGVVRE